MNSKKLIRLTEVDLHRIVKRSVNKVLNEGGMQVNFPNTNNGIEKKLFRYEKLVHRIKTSAEDLKTIAEHNGTNNSSDANYDVERELVYLADKILGVLEELGFEDGFDPTEHINW